MASACAHKQTQVPMENVRLYGYILEGVFCHRKILHKFLQFVHMRSYIFVKFARFTHYLCPARMEQASTIRRACVRAIQGEERLQIYLQYPLTEEKFRVFNLNRLQQEELNKTIERLSANILKESNKALKKKNKKQKLAPQEDTPVHMIAVTQKGTEDALDTSIPNLQAFSDGNSLHIGHLVYEICVNLPTVTELSLPQSIMAGFPAQPKFEFEFADFKKCSFKWFKKSEEAMPSASSDGQSVNWEQIYDGFVYIASNDLIGHTLRVTCIPSDGMRDGAEVEAVSKCEVSASPGHCPFMDRHAFTETKTGEGRSVI